MQEYIDLRSDTVTQPTQEMRKAMFEAQVGDDIMGEDLTVKELEALSADLLGKEAAMFVTSGTMGNQIAVMTLAQRGEEVIVGDTSHIYNMESGALAALSQVQTRVIGVPDGIYDIVRLEQAIQEKGLQNPKTGLICLEDTNNLNAGLVVPLDNLQAVYSLAKRHGLPVHLDGARIFNAAAASRTSLKDIAGTCDSLMFALTKGLAAPFGAILAGDKAYIDEARWIKQRLGGGFRQAGFLAAPGIVALKTMLPRLETDHALCQLLGKELAALGVLKVDTARIHTNILTGSVEDLPLTIEEFLERLQQKGIKAKRISKTSFRMVTHYGIEETQVRQVVEAIKEIIHH